MDLLDILFVKKLVGDIEYGEISSSEALAIMKQLEEKISKEELQNYINEISNTEIDAICGETSLLISESLIVDSVTGTTYKIFVEDSKLRMEETNEFSNTETLTFVDESTDTVYQVYVENENLHMEEVE